MLKKFPKIFKKKKILLDWRVFLFILSLIIVPFFVWSLTLSVDISADPSSGIAPLNDVDLTATVSGTASGNITYKFDCTSDGSWEKTITTGSTNFTAYDLCDYPSAGNYVATVSVEREGLVFLGKTAILVQSGSGLSVNLSANPSSGNAPLENVDLTATVSGTASGDITYKFDCQADGSWEKTITTGNTSYTAVDLCDYLQPGNYTAKVSVEREGLSFQGTTAIVVYSGEVLFKIEKLARNISKNQTDFGDPISAEPSDRIEFQIKLTSLGQDRAENIILKDTLPNLLIYKGNLKIDGISSPENIISGINLGDLSPNQSKTINFEVEVSPPESFTFGTTPLINTVMAYNEKMATTDTAKVNVEKKGVAGVATAVKTGLIKPFILAFLGAIFIGFILSYFFLFRFYFLNYILPNAVKAKAERDLERAINKIKERERKFQK